jgi:hypothetical protein
LVKINENQYESVLNTYGENELICDYSINVRAPLNSKVVAISDVQCLTLKQITY